MEGLEMNERLRDDLRPNCILACMIHNGHVTVTAMDYVNTFEHMFRNDKLKHPRRGGICKTLELARHPFSITKDDLQHIIILSMNIYKNIRANIQ
jgi:hypothetical protein